MHGWKVVLRVATACSFLAFGGARVDAQAITASFDDFELERWMDVDQSDGPVTIHRIRVSTEQAGVRARGAGIALNRQYVRPIGVQIEFTNEGGRSYRSYVTVRLLDATGEAVDGFGDEERLEANRARGLITRSFAASKYGLKRVERLELEVKLNP